MLLAQNKAFFRKPNTLFMLKTQDHHLKATNGPDGPDLPNVPYSIQPHHHPPPAHLSHMELSQILQFILLRLSFSLYVCLFFFLTHDPTNIRPSQNRSNCYGNVSSLRNQNLMSHWQSSRMLIVIKRAGDYRWTTHIEITYMILDTAVKAIMQINKTHQLYENKTPPLCHTPMLL